MKARKCIVIGNTRSGYCSAPQTCESIAKAVRYGKIWFAYRIYDYDTKKIIKRGFGD